MRLDPRSLVITVLVAALAALASPAGAVNVLEEHANGGTLQQNWQPGFGVGRVPFGMVMPSSDPAFTNPSGDHTVVVLVNVAPDSGGIALSCVDPQGQSDYTWEGWMFTGNGNTRRGLVLRADPTNQFQSCYQFVLNAGMAQLVFRKLVGQSPTTLRNWFTNTLPGGVPALNSWHHMKVMASANTFRVYWDGAELTSALNPVVDAVTPRLSGFVGIYNFRFDLGGVPVYFDDLVLSTDVVVPARSSSWGQIKRLYR